jgi:Ran GTPase-activating protein (RanGAP) involved in mRNA processing and transport
MFPQLIFGLYILYTVTSSHIVEISPLPLVNASTFLCLYVIVYCVLRDPQSTPQTSTMDDHYESEEACLELILKEIAENPTWMDVEDYKVGDSGATAIAGFLAGSTSLTGMNVCSASIGSAGMVAIALALQHNDSLEKLFANANDFDNVAIEALANALKKNKGLTELELEEINISADGAAALADMLKHNTTLSALSLSSFWDRSEGDGGFICIGDVGAESLAGALKVNSTLTELDLSRNQIGIAGATALADALTTNKGLEEVNLSKNAIGDEGLVALVDALKYNTTLVFLSLQHNNIGIAGVTAFADALTTNKGGLKSVDLSKNVFGDEGLAALADALSHNTTLKSLELRGTGITDEGVLAIINVLKVRNCTLEWLCLIGNPNVSPLVLQAVDDVLASHQVFNFGLERLREPVLGQEIPLIVEAVNRDKISPGEIRCLRAKLSHCAKDSVNASFIFHMLKAAALNNSLITE